MPKALVRTGTCKTCLHGERGRIDWLVAAGESVTAVAAQFGLTHDSVSRHFSGHVTPQFKRAVKVGSTVSEAELARVCAESGRSVLEHLRANVATLSAQIAISQEAGAVNHLVSLIRERRENLALIGKITREYLPAGGVTNNYNIQLNVLAKVGADLIPALKDQPDAQRLVIDVVDRWLALPAEEWANAA